MPLLNKRVLYRAIGIALTSLMLFHGEVCAAASQKGGTKSSVRVWEEDIEIPTYLTGPADPNPMFYTHESYQGAQKKLYPYPVIDALSRDRENKAYTALNLENEYIKLTVLPELGGRLFSAVDKTNGYDFFYRQHVIKPALIGMLGAWISGGIEWCVFHHHRNTTFMPVDYTLSENPDGSKTVWFGETERRHRMKWIIGLTLHPGKSVIEANVRFFNRTPMPHSILYWSNVAVHVNDDYQVIFPPSVQVATYHSKIDFTYWPISRGRYRGSNYEGVDISWWKNSEASNSFFAWDLQENFMGGYDHGKEAGVVHVGNHHIVCGAKLWEWGTGTNGQMWDKILTDTDGPYAELMVGAFSDNQPDYSWIKPYEVKAFKQCWFPVREIGGFKNANLNGAVNLEMPSEGKAALGFHVTSPHKKARVALKAKGEVIFEKTVTLSPEAPFQATVPIPAGIRQTNLRASLQSADGEELLAYQPVEQEPVDELPDTVKAPPTPGEVKTIEELYLTGLRVEQIHNPKVDPLDYYNKALQRDPGDTRSNTALGIHYNKYGLYEKAETHLRKAIERLSAGYTRPENTEAYFHLGLSLRGQGRLDEAYDSFYRASWDSAFHPAAYEQLAELSCRRGDFAQALDQIDRSLATNALNTNGMGIKSMILRRLGKTDQAMDVASQAMAVDSLDFLAANEMYLAKTKAGKSREARRALRDLSQNMRDSVQSYLELATDYMNCGLWDEAIDVLERPVNAKAPFASTYPLVHYYLGYLHAQKGEQERASESYARAKQTPPDYCFPFRLETADVLNAALEADPKDARAWYYLGNLLFDLQPERAMECWEKALSLDKDLALAHRNLGWGYYRVKNDVPEAIGCYEQAVGCDPLVPRFYSELDTLYEVGNVSPERRLAMLEKHHETVVKHNTSFLREIMVLVLVGQYDDAINDLANSFFHVREGGGQIHDVYADAHLLKGLQCMSEDKPKEALDHFRLASEYPENLSVGRPGYDRRAPEIAYHTGTALEAAGDAEGAKESYDKAAAGRSRSSGWPQARFCQGLSLGKLGREDEARKTFEALTREGRERLAEKEESDFFAKFGEQETREARLATAHFTIGLGLLGQGDKDAASTEFERAVELNQSLVWARYHLSRLLQQDK